MSKFVYTAASLLLLVLGGCGGSGKDPTSLNAELSVAIARFENADANFGPATNYDELIANGHYLDRMGEEILNIERIEDRAVSQGAKPIPEVREELVSRFRRRLASLQSSAEHLNAMTSFKIAEMWLNL